MNDFSNITDLKTLKTEYRRLAKKFHPDKGGNLSTMQIINKKYGIRYTALKESSTITKIQNKNNFDHIEVGDTVWINGTESEVIQVQKDCFRVVAKGRNRQAVFDKACGIGKYNSGLFASFNCNNRKMYN